MGEFALGSEVRLARIGLTFVWVRWFTPAYCITSADLHRYAIFGFVHTMAPAKRRNAGKLNNRFVRSLARNTQTTVTLALV